MARPSDDRQKLLHPVLPATRGIIATLTGELNKEGPGHLIDDMALALWKLVRGDEPPPPPPPKAADAKGRGGPRTPKPKI